MVAERHHALLYYSSVFLLHVATVEGYYIQPDPISFTQHPSSQVVLKQSTVELQCAFDLISLNSELPQPRIEWQFNDEPTSCTNINSNDDDSSLISTCTIEAVDAYDSGWYQCVVVDGNRKKCKILDCIPTKTVSRPAFLHVISAISNPTSVELDSNSTNAILSCFAMPESVIAQYTTDLQTYWKKDGVTVDNSTEGATVLPSGRLLIQTFSAVVDRVVGNYTCWASNGVDSEVLVSRYNILPPSEESYISPSLSLQLYSSYGSIDHAHSMYVLSASLVELVCLVRDNASLWQQVTWSKDNLDVAMSESGIEDGLWYRWEGQSGRYCCRAESIGNSCITIEAIEPSEYGDRNVTEFVDLTENITLSCISSPLPARWLFNGEPVSVGSVSSDLELSGIVMQDFGIYQCLMSNTSTSPLTSYRILPYGWVNPPSLFTYTILPTNSSDRVYFSLDWMTSKLSGGLNMEDLKFNVSIHVLMENGDSSLSYKITPEPSLNLTFIYDYTQQNAFEFKVATLDEDGQAISENVELNAQSNNPCSFYPPQPPSFTIVCHDGGPVVVWHRTPSSVFDTDTFGGMVYCHSGNTPLDSITISDNKNPDALSGELVYNVTLSINDTCTAELHGARIYTSATKMSCTGPPVTHHCTRSHTTAASSSAGAVSTPSSSSSALATSTLVPTSTTNSTMIVTTLHDPTTSVPVGITLPPTSSTIVPSTVSSTVSITVSDTLSNTASSTIVSSTVSIAVSNTIPSTLVSSTVVIVSAIVGVVLMLLVATALTALCCIINKLYKIKKRSSVTLNPFVYLDDNNSKKIQDKPPQDDRASITTEFNYFVDPPPDEVTPPPIRTVSTPDICVSTITEMIGKDSLENEEEEKCISGSTLRVRSSSDSTQYSSSTSSSRKTSSVSDNSDNTGSDLGSGYLNIIILDDPKQCFYSILEEPGGEEAKDCDGCNSSICASPVTDRSLSNSNPSPMRHSLNYGSKASIEVPIELSDYENLRGMDDTCQPNKEIESDT